MVCGAIVDPSLILESRECFVDVETAGELTRGYSVIDTLGTLGKEANATVIEAFDVDRFYELFRDVLS
jgi:purine nucleosidase